VRETPPQSPYAIVPKLRQTSWQET